MRAYLVDHPSYSDLHDIAVEHARPAEVALEGDTDAFKRELAQHFQSALRGKAAGNGDAPAGPDALPRVC